MPSYWFNVGIFFHCYLVIRLDVLNQVNPLFTKVFFLNLFSNQTGHSNPVQEVSPNLKCLCSVLFFFRVDITLAKIKIAVVKIK